MSVVEIPRVDYLYKRIERYLLNSKKKKKKKDEAKTGANNFSQRN